MDLLFKINTHTSVLSTVHKKSSTNKLESQSTNKIQPAVHTSSSSESTLPGFSTKKKRSEYRDAMMQLEVRNTILSYLISSYLMLSYLHDAYLILSYMKISNFILSP